jgi:acyl carrier protein
MPWSGPATPPGMAHVPPDMVRPYLAFHRIRISHADGSPRPPKSASRLLAMTVPGETQVRSRIRAIITELAPDRPVPSAAKARLIEDLGYHSLALLELAFALEDEFDLPPIDETVAGLIHTIGDVEDHVVGQLAIRASAVPDEPA